ncbi:peptidase S8 [Paenibacillus psychroresistens]|uniref:Peptidase S8 n=1 Tax=Paenibacillus psychroresistens TaxID=1778678 RepID=A0A6B8RAX6_9BACL|nr:S8 family serine peptidase [Paenibacillus psychroresistens]QGQ93490.1 peptidase S8 [Paenibacillus psychroresistens]
MKRIIIKGLLCLALVSTSLSIFQANEVSAAPQLTDKLTIAIVDTGVDLEHADLKKYLVSGTNLVKPKTTPMDDNGHGTNVAGVIVEAVLKNSIARGIAWTPRIMPVKALDNEGTGDEERLGAGISYAVDHGARIVLLSLGLNKFSAYLSGVVEKAEKQGVLLIAASGNEGESVKYPAAYASVLAVGGVKPNLVAEERSNYGIELDVVAPWNVYTTAKGGGYERQEGTSMAAPQVAAACALLWTKYPTMSPAEIRNMIRQTAQDIGPKGWDEHTGYGLLRTDLALVDKPLDDIYESNNQAATAKRLPFGKKSEAALSDKTDTDWYIIDAPYSGSLQMDIVSDSTEAKSIEMTYYKKLTETGTTYKGLATKEVSFQVTKGRNYLRIRSLTASATTIIKYQMYPQLFVNPDSFEDNDRKFKAYVLPARSQMITGTFHQNSDQDWFMLPITEAGTLRLKLSTDTSRIDSVLRIEKTGMKTQIIDQKSDGQTETSLPLEVTPGNYYFLVSNVKDYSFPIIGEYILQIDYDKYYIDPNEPNDRSFQSTGMNSGVTYDGVLDESTDVDWFSFNVEKESLVHLELTNIPHNRTIYLSLQNYVLKTINNSENTADSTKINLDTYLLPGKYYIELKVDESFQNQLYHIKMEASPVLAGFADISKHWAKDSIVKLANLNLINGYGNYRFLPDQTITRAEAVSILNKAFSWKNQSTSTFKDVLATDWYNQAIVNASKENVASGYPDGSFKPNQELNRMEMAALLSRTQGKQSVDTSISSFSDIDKTYWGADILGEMKTKGWILGFKDGSFQPDRLATRAEFAQLLVKIMNY